MLTRLRLKQNLDEYLVMEFLMGSKSDYADSVLVRFTKYAMSERLKEKRDSGFFGWNTPQVENGELLNRLGESLLEGKYIDVINFAAMLLAREKMFVEEHHEAAVAGPAR